MRIFVVMLWCVFLVGCGNYENDKIAVKKAKENNPLLIPPCLK
jgi:PBP1b-binding outer membrane lipoprotein LpoB